MVLYIDMVLEYFTHKWKESNVSKENIMLLGRNWKNLHAQYAKAQTVNAMK